MVYQRTGTLDRVFACLADPTRREILERLSTGDRTISELAAGFDMSLPAVSKHVRVLERAGLARIRREGRARRTTLVAAPLHEARAWIERYRRFWEFQLDQLAEYLEDDTSWTAASDVPDTPDRKESAPWRRAEPKESKPSKSVGQSRRPRRASSRRGRPPKS